MLQIIAAAFTMGILGSFHCVGMCGPLALSLPLTHQDLFSKFLGAFIYNIGRVITYALLGLLFGILGKSFAFFGLQQWISIIMGILIILFVVLPKAVPSLFRKFHNSLNMLNKIRTPLGRLLKEGKMLSLFTIGLLNGLLPCGLVYIAIAAAVATGDLYGSMVFMACFGLGTLPVMWSLAFFGNYIGQGLRQQIRKAYPVMIMAVACLLILRGMGLGIKYISPAMDTKKGAVIKCCSKPEN